MTRADHTKDQVAWPPCGPPANPYSVCQGARGPLRPGRWWRQATSAGLGAPHPEQPT